MKSPSLLTFVLSFVGADATLVEAAAPFRLAAVPKVLNPGKDGMPSLPSLDGLSGTFTEVRQDLNSQASDFAQHLQLVEAQEQQRLQQRKDAYDRKLREQEAGNQAVVRKNSDLARKILKLRKHNEQLQEQVTAENKMIKFRREQFSSMEKQLEAGEKFMHNVLADTDMQKEVSMLGLGAKKAAPTAAPQQEAEPVSFLELNARKKHHHKKHLRLVSSALEESADVAPAPRADSAESVIAATELIIDNEPETQPALELDVSKSPAVPAVKPAPEVENDVQKKPMARLAAPGLPTQVHVPLFPLADGTGVVEAAAQSKAEKDADEDEELDVSKSPAVPAVKPAPEATAQSTGIKEAKKDADEDEELPAVPAMKPAPEAATPVMQAKEVKTQEADEEPVEIELPPSMAEKSPEDDEKLFSSLSQQLTRMRSAAQKTEKHLKAMFEDSWKAGKTRHEALLNQQAVLEKSLTSMTTYEGKLEKTSEHFKAVIQTLEHQLGLGANFLEHIEKEAVAPVKEVRAAAQEADASNPLVIASNN